MLSWVGHSQTLPVPCRFHPLFLLLLLNRCSISCFYDNDAVLQEHFVGHPFGPGPAPPAAVVAALNFACQTPKSTTAASLLLPTNLTRQKFSCTGNTFSHVVITRAGLVFVVPSSKAVRWLKVVRVRRGKAKFNNMSIATLEWHI